MKPPLPIDNIRRFLKLNQHLIKSSGIAAEINKSGDPVSAALLFRVLTENLEQQREAAPKLVTDIEKVLTTKFNYNPEINYLEHPEKA